MNVNSMTDEQMDEVVSKIYAEQRKRQEAKKRDNKYYKPSRSLLEQHGAVVRENYYSDYFDNLPLSALRFLASKLTPTATAIANSLQDQISSDFPHRVFILGSLSPECGSITIYGAEVRLNQRHLSLEDLDIIYNLPSIFNDRGLCATIDYDRSNRRFVIGNCL